MTLPPIACSAILNRCGVVTHQPKSAAMLRNTLQMELVEVSLS